MDPRSDGIIEASYIGLRSLESGRAGDSTSLQVFGEAGRREGDSSWTKIGVGFVHEDGKGFDVVLEALPVSGRVVLRLNQPKPKGGNE